MATLARPCICGGIRASMRVIACIEDPMVIKKILTHLNEKLFQQNSPIIRQPGAIESSLVPLMKPTIQLESLLPKRKWRGVYWLEGKH